MKKRPAIDYPAGHFCALVNEHNWPPEFVSRMPAKSLKVVPQNHRGNGGFDRHTLTLQGAIPYIQRGPVKDMGRQT